eukprot:scaffold14290_cov125-Isochrysis_galbana.AAC.2
MAPRSSTLPLAHSVSADKPIVIGSECMRHDHTNGPQTAQAQLPRTEQGCSPLSSVTGPRGVDVQADV